MEFSPDWRVSTVIGNKPFSNLSLQQTGWVTISELGDMFGMKDDRTVKHHIEKAKVPTVTFGATLLVYMPMFYDALVKEQLGMEAHADYRRMVETTDGQEAKREKVSLS